MTTDLNYKDGSYHKEPINVSTNIGNKINLYFPETNKYKGQLISDVGLYSITKPDEANYITHLISTFFKDTTNIVITDATSGLGGNVISFAKYFKHVNAVEKNKIHCDMLKNNIKVYKIEDKTTIYCDSYVNLVTELKQDIVFIDPPWGGTDYRKIKMLNLFLDKVPIVEVCNQLIVKTDTKIICLKVSYNFNFSEFFTKIKSKIFYTYKIKNYYLIIIMSALDDINMKDFKHGFY